MFHVFVVVCVDTVLTPGLRDDDACRSSPRKKKEMYIWLSKAASSVPGSGTRAPVGRWIGYFGHHRRQVGRTAAGFRRRERRMRSIWDRENFSSSSSSSTSSSCHHLQVQTTTPEGYVGSTIEDLHANERKQAPPSYAWTDGRLAKSAAAAALNADFPPSPLRLARQLLSFCRKDEL